MLLEYSVEKPLNREPPIDELLKRFLTKPSVAYDRNHGPLPHIDAESHKVRIDGSVPKVVELSVGSLRSDYEQHEVIAALQCAGNRRHSMRTEIKEVDGINWHDGAVCNATWKGPLLADILKRAGVDPDQEAHVCFNCYKTDVQDDTYYGGSVPLARCMDTSKSAILALEMNGRQLTINHGYPVRVVLPGIAGARWTKWLDRITIQKEESQNYYMQRDYKILPPEVETKEQALASWHRFPAIQGMPVNSIVACPQTGSTIYDNDLRNGELEICGYALPACDDGPIAKVEVSVDLGRTWRVAEFVFPSRADVENPEGRERYRWAWAVWKCRLPKDDVLRLGSSGRVWSRAEDAGGNRQSERKMWNYRGVAYSAYGEAKDIRVIKMNGLARGVNGMRI